MDLNSLEARIDDYIEDNPLGLPPRELAQMHRWKQRVTGPLPLIGFDDENRGSSSWARDAWQSRASRRTSPRSSSSSRRYSST